VQGSLRTYADYLGLDTEALVRELKYLRASRDEPQRPAYGEPPKSGAVGPRYAAPTLNTAGSTLLYLGSAALLVLVLGVVAFASTLAAPGQPQISQVREPLASQVPGGGGGELAGLPDSESDERNGGEESGSPPPEHEPSDGDAEEKESGRKEQAEESQDQPGGAHDPYASTTAHPSTATATATASQSTVIPVSPPGPTGPADRGGPGEYPFGRTGRRAEIDVARETHPTLIRPKRPVATR
jgi:cytoskeletal protein RodZ